MGLMSPLSDAYDAFSSSCFSFSSLRQESDPSIRVNLANSALSDIPKFITLGHLTVKTADIRNLDFVTANRAKNLKRLLRGTERDDGLDKTHDFETMSQTTD